MKELRSAVNALFLFAVFLLLYSAVVPGHARGSVRGPRFLRMQVEDTHEAGHPVKVSFSVPYGFVTGALRFASLGKVRRELDLHFDESVDAAEIRTIVQELKDKPDGTDVVREHEHETLHVRKEGETAMLEVEKRDRPEENVTLRVPWRIVDALATSERDLDVSGLVAELRDARRGDLLEVTGPDAHLRIWIE
ncbi:MAG TPA: hypothetical protein VMN04_03140 [Thermoanaerobaculia bacterium]|nr:hypothetical protein [Thermoanaerobaculia bacterium]